MDGQNASISPHELSARLGAATAPLVLDVRRVAAFEKAYKLIVSAKRASRPCRLMSAFGDKAGTPELRPGSAFDPERKSERMELFFHASSSVRLLVH